MEILNQISETLRKGQAPAVKEMCRKALDDGLMDGMGTDVSAEKFLETVKSENAGIICCSALLTTTMTYMKDIVNTFEEDGKRNDVTIMVGDAPVTQNFCDTIGANIYSADAAGAADAALGALAS